MAPYFITFFSVLLYTFTSYCIQPLASEDIGFIAPIKVLTFNDGKYLSSQNDFVIEVNQLQYRYVVDLNIGSPPQILSLRVDTGSYLTWIESSLCKQKQCFQPDPTLRFYQDKSTTYTKIMFNERVCQYASYTFKDPYGNCLFQMNYEEGDWTMGNLARDVLSAITDQNEPDVLKPILNNFVFGSSTTSSLTHGNYSALSGIFGLVPTNDSLLGQLGVTKFSHCFIHYNNPDTNYISFGNQSSLVGSSVPFRSSRNFYYSVALYGISVNGKRLDIPDFYLHITQVEENLILDSGTTLTWLFAPVIMEIERELRDLIGPEVYHPSLTCFQTSTSGTKNEEYIKKLPKITLHLDKFNFTLPNIGIYQCDKYSTCCILFQSVSVPNEGNKIGVSAQVNYNIGYDITAKRIYFQEKDCTLEE